MDRSLHEKGDFVSPQLIENICNSLASGEAVRRNLLDGRLNIDRQLPFLCLYRRPEGVWDVGTDRLVMSEASYLVASGHSPLHRGLRSLLNKVVATLSDIFGAFLIIEIWSALENNQSTAEEKVSAAPGFKIIMSPDYSDASTADTLHTALLNLRILKRAPAVEVTPGHRTGAGLRPIFSAKEAANINCHWIGLEVRPIYRNASRQEEFPLVRRALVRSLSKALKRAFYEFTRSQTTRRPPNYQALGKRAFVKTAWVADRQLAEIDESFDLLFHVNPVNTNSAWSEFRRSKFERSPRFLYPRLPIEPAAMKKKLYSIAMERIEDPVVEEIFREKRDELDRRLTLLVDRGTSRFLYGSLQLYGEINSDLLKLARDILDKVPPRSRDDSHGGPLDAEEFSTYAEKEINRYKSEFNEFRGTWQIYDGPAGLMVSRGNLLIGRRVKIPRGRAEALIQHEIGTHMVTYYNALSQPFRMLGSGLAGYDELQEGLAVLAEYLCGGFSRPRLRLLAARVVAVHRLIEGASFVDVFRELDRYYDFGRLAAFTITLRVFRGGGLTKDASYLRGLVALLDYYRQDGPLEPLFIGKFAIKHIPFVKELLAREVLHKAPLLPYYMRAPMAKKRLERLRAGVSLIDLTKKES